MTMMGSASPLSCRWKLDAKYFGSQKRRNHQTGSVRNLPTSTAQHWRYPSRRSQGILADFSDGALRMWASSAAPTRGSFSGLLYVVHQSISHSRLKPPVKRNADCQPRWTVSQGTARGTTIAPTLVPLLKMPVARARSFLGNHSATVLIAAGKLPDSPRPRKKREMPKESAERASAWLMEARLQRPMESV